MKNKYNPLLLILIGIAIFGVSLIIITVLNNNTQTNKFTAVFMESGQVYFGKITEENGDSIKLTEVYYLQFSDNSSQTDLNSNENKFNLIKRGNELHGPEDLMNINKRFILFTEVIRDDSKILETINQN